MTQDKHGIVKRCDPRLGVPSYYSCFRTLIILCVVSTHATSSNGGVVQWKEPATFAGVK